MLGCSTYALHFNIEAICSSNGLYQFTAPPGAYDITLCSTFSPTIATEDILLLAHLIGMKYLIIVLICSSLTTGQVEHFGIHLSAIQFFFL